MSFNNFLTGGADILKVKIGHDATSRKEKKRRDKSDRYARLKTKHALEGPALGGIHNC